MATSKLTRKQIKVTRQANEHADEIIRVLKAAGQAGASKTRLVSQWILTQRIPGFVHNNEKKLSVVVDYCPQCEQVQPYHNGHCHTCGTALLHMTAIETDELVRLMHMLRIVNLRKDD